MENQKYNLGLETLTKVDGDGGHKVIDSLNSIAPDLGKYIIEFAFGEVYNRSGLTLKQRELATIAGLTAMGKCQPQLKVHINGAINVGCSRKEIIEVIIQMAVYAGFPAALNGISVAKEVFNEVDSMSE